MNRVMRFPSVAWVVSGSTDQTPIDANEGRYGVPFVEGSAVTGLSPAELDNLFKIEPDSTPQQQAETFPQSIASGDPAAHGIVLWTRVAPAATASLAQAIVAWQLSSTGDFSTVLISGLVTVSAAQDNTAKVAIWNSAIQPFTTYYYRFIFNGISSRTGRFKTLPRADDQIEEIKLAYVVCQDYGNGFYTALHHLAQEEVDYVLHLGDYIYESITSSSFQNNPARIVPPFPSGSTSIPVDVNDYRHLYQVYRSDPNQQAVHERFAYFQLWDDHEFANDCHQDFHPDDNSGTNTPATPQPALRQAANQAWAEHGLAAVQFDGSQNWDESILVYRKFSLGALADLIVTDERLYRDGPPCGDGQRFQRYFSPGCAAMGDINRSMLGVVQRDWFLQQLTSSKATWKLWANEVMLMQLKAAGIIYVDLDQWDGYQAERNLIMEAVKSNGVKNLIALTGDLHTFLAGYLRRNFDDPFESPAGIELMVGSITSANLAEDIEAATHHPSAPLPAKGFGVPPNLLEPFIRLNNPHIQYWDSSTHGYALLTLTPSLLTCVFKAVTTVREPEAALVTLRTFTIADGSTKLHQH